MNDLSANPTMSAHAANTAAHRQSSRWLVMGAAWAGLSLGGLVWTLAGMTIDRTGGADAATRNAHALWPYWIAGASCWLGLTMILLALRRSMTQRPCSRQAAMILGIAVLARAIVLTTHAPALSDDVYRYVFDGRNLAAGLNPYLTDPKDRTAALQRGELERWPGERDLLPLLAYPEVTTPYLPASQYVFAAMGKVSAWGGWTSPSASSRVFRIGFTMIEVVMMCVIWLVLRRRGLSPWWLALYAWHPLALDGFAASGHQDIIGIALMVAALVLLQGFAGRSRGYLRTVGSSTTLAAAVMVKPVALLAGILALRRRRIGDWLVMVVGGAAVCIALAQPLHWRPTTPEYAAWKTTADWMAEKAAHFGGMYEPVLCAVRHAMPDGPDRKPGFNLEQEWLARKICMWTLASALLFIVLRARDAWRSTAAAMLALVLCSTTCHPWYLLWAFALFPVARSGWTLWTYALTISWSYAVFITGKGHGLGVEWTLHPLVLAMAYIPVLVALVADIGGIAFGDCATPRAAVR